MTLWKRQYRVRFPTLDLEFANTLRIMFDASKDLTEETNKSELKLYNLSYQTRSKIQVADMKVEIYAGYEKNGGPVRIFTGSVIEAQTKDEGKDTITELRLSDGSTSLRDSVFSLSYAPGTPGNRIIERIGSEMGLPVVFGEGATFGSFSNGYSYVGNGTEAMNEICYGSGCTWSIQNDSLQVILAGGIASNKGLVFAPDSGLIGSPERIIRSNPKPDKDTPKRQRRQAAGKEKPKKQAGWKIRTLLAPTVNPGDAIKVESEIITGWFRVESLKHRGDSHGGDWISEMDLIERLMYT